jgi:hypothetical protein
MCPGDSIGRAEHQAVFLSVVVLVGNAIIDATPLSQGFPSARA